jgi:predicted dehydrogenase
MPDAPKIAVIGAGWAARIAHLPAYTNARVAPVAIADLNTDIANAEAKKHGIPNVYSDWREMIEKEKPDAVSVCVPNVYHRELVLGCLASGAHVLCEKPLATSVAEAKEMFAAAKSAGKHLMAAQNWRWNDNSRAIRRIIDTGDMGEIYYGEATALRRMGIPTWGQFHYKQHSHGGAMLDVGVHMLDLAIYLMDNPKPTRVSSQMATKFGQRPEIAKLMRSAWDPAKFDVEDFAVALVHFENGASLLLRTSWATHIDAETFSVRLIGTEAGATTHPPVVFRNHAGIPVDEKLQVPQGDWTASYNREISHWLKVIRGDEQPLVKPEETLNVQRIIDAAYKSAEEGREITVEA